MQTRVNHVGGRHENARLARWRVGDDPRHAMTFHQLRRLVAEPAAVSGLAGEGALEASMQTFKEPAGNFLVEDQARRQLHQNASEFFSQRASLGRKSCQQIINVK